MKRQRRRAAALGKIVKNAAWRLSVQTICSSATIGREAVAPHIATNVHWFARIAPKRCVHFVPSIAVGAALCIATAKWNHLLQCRVAITAFASTVSKKWPKIVAAERLCVANTHTAVLAQRDARNALFQRSFRQRDRMLD